MWRRERQPEKLKNTYIFIMSRYIVILTVVMTSLYLTSCNNNNQTFDEDAIYEIADEEPEFPGGWTACMEYCRQNIKYPETARELRIEEKLLVRFAIMKDGSIDSVEIIRSAGNQSLEEEAIRIVKTMPKWKPARLSGKVVNCWYTIPIVFKLSEE